MANCTAALGHMIRELINRLCDWKQYETVKNRDSVNSTQCGNKDRDSFTSCHTMTSININERTSLTLHISNRNKGLFMVGLYVKYLSVTFICIGLKYRPIQSFT